MWTERAKLKFDGDIITNVVIERGRENRPLWETLERLSPDIAVKWSDRFSAIEAISAEWAIASCFEQSMKVEPTRRAEGLRTLFAEIQRLIWASTYLSELFASLEDRILHQQALRLRELILEAMETLSGSRILPQVFCIGGVERNLTPGEARKVRALIRNFDYELRVFFKGLSNDLVLLERLSGLLPITTKTALRLGLRGPVGQASGVARDLRIQRPYGFYGSLKVDTFTLDNQDWFHSAPLRGVLGDAFSRMRAVIFQARQSAELLEKILDNLPEGEVKTKIPEGTETPLHPFWFAVEGGSGPIVATVCGGAIRVESYSTRMADFFESLLVGVHADDFELAAASLGLDPAQVDLC